MNKKILNVLLISIPLSCFGQAIPPEIPDGYCSEFTLKLAYFFGTLDLIEKMPPIPENLVEHKDLVYSEVDGRTLKLDVYHLDNVTQAKPLLLFIHGGAWKKGKKKDYRRYLVDFAIKGYITASVQYSLSSEAKFPTPVNDIKRAIRWIKSNSEKFFINPEKIALIGGSAGGHLAMMVGYSRELFFIEQSIMDSNYSSEVQAIVNIYGPSDLTTEYARTNPTVEYFLDRKYSEDEFVYSVASPVSYLSADDPPTLIFHGSLDELVPINQSDSLKSKLDKMGLYSEYHRLDGWPHTMDLSVEVNEYCQYYMERFFEKYLMDRNGK